MSTPNPQAVEAAAITWYEMKYPKNTFAFVDEAVQGACRDTVARILQAAEPHIRSQLLTELAEEFKNRELITQREANRAGSRGEMDAQAFERGRSSGFGAAASHCRELAAKEESDG